MTNRICGVQPAWLYLRTGSCCLAFLGSVPWHTPYSRLRPLHWLCGSCRTDSESELVKVSVPNKSLCSAESLTLTVAQSRAKVYSDAACRLWISLSVDLRIKISLTSFKTKLKVQNFQLVLLRNIHYILPHAQYCYLFVVWSLVFLLSSYYVYFDWCILYIMFMLLLLLLLSSKFQLYLTSFYINVNNCVCCFWWM